MSDASSRGRRNRQRGQEGERELANILTDALGYKVNRLLGQERDKGSDVSTPPYRWEIKRRKRIGLIYEWMDEAQDALQSASERPVVAFRADSKAWVVCLPLNEFIRLIREELDYGQSEQAGRSNSLLTKP